MLSKLKALGPGLLYAGAAIGVSHIVQSTKAGAQYGWILILGILLAHIFKYPFFELGPRYTAIKGENLLQGYARLGKWALALVILLTISTMFTIQAAVTVVTAGLANKILNISIAPWQMSALLLVICFGILAINKFSLLDNLMKVIMIILAITTIVAFIASFYADIDKSSDFMTVFDPANSTHILFLIAFLGWMPAPLDISIWHSLWSEESNRSKGTKATLGQTLFDFKVGFWGTAALAVCFLMLGANVIYGTGQELSDKGAVYAGQLIDMYSTSLGTWAYWIIAIAAFTTMFSTTLTCLDAVPRVLTEAIRVWNPNAISSEKQSNTLRYGNMAIIAVGSVYLLARHIGSMKQMVNIATVISFLTAPVIAILGMMLVHKHTDASFWSAPKRLIAWIGIVLLIGLIAYYVYLMMT